MKYTVIALTVVFASLMLVAPALAQNFAGDAQSGGTGIVRDNQPPKHLLVNISPQCRDFGDCTLCDAFTVLRDIAKWLLATIGGLALFFIIDGGFGLITSGGSPEKVEAGKKKIVGSLMGLLVVVGAWTFMGILVAIFGLSSPEAGERPGTSQVAKNLFSWQSIKCGE